MRTKPPCAKDCPMRAEGCHGKCKDYQDWQAVHAAEMEKEHKARNIDKMITDVLATQGERAKQANKRRYYNKQKEM